jgi:hypothetical protein
MSPVLKVNTENSASGCFGCIFPAGSISKLQKTGGKSAASNSFFCCQRPHSEPVCKDSTATPVTFFSVKTTLVSPLTFFYLYHSNTAKPPLMRRFLISLLLTATLFAAFISFKGKFNSSQPPSNHSGAPDGFGTCANCHGNLNTGGGSVTVTGLPAHYQPGVTYPFSVTISHPTERERWGFQINARNANGSKIGTFASTNPNATLGSGPAELSHNDAVFSSGTTYTYDSLTWTAPSTVASGDNSVTFYLAGNAANGDFNNSGDFIYTSTRQIVLPVTLKSLDYRITDNKVILNWTTSSESNSREFIIEKSSNGKEFYPAGRVAAAGYSSAEKTYSFTDDQAVYFNQPLYYRLKMVDHDDKARYSKIIQLIISGRALFVQSLFPNPATHRITLTILSASATGAELSITDAAGKILKRETVQLRNGRNTHEMQLTTLQKGNYFLRVQTKEHRQTMAFAKL